MKVGFDTSVLVSGLVAAHPQHARARRWLVAARAGGVEAMMSWHAIAETWSVLTRLPLAPAISGELARDLLHTLRTFIEPVTPDEGCYQAALARCAARGLRSGAVYDALHLVAAERMHADLLLTWNRYDFERLAAKSGPMIASPDDEPPA
jgi:predicted nucleic acid-binding protein